jgi:hypothetical protein
MGYSTPPGVKGNVGVVELKPKVGEQQTLPKTVQLVGHAAYAESIRSTANNRNSNEREDMLDVERKIKKRAYHKHVE